MDPERLQLIDLANKSFGEAGWSFSISNVALDFIDKNSSGHHVVGASAIVRVQLPNGIFREDVGYGSETGSSKSGVIYKAKMDAVNMGLRGAISCFGGEFVRKLNSLTPSKGMNEKIESENPLLKISSPSHVTTKPYVVSKATNDGQLAPVVPLKTPVTPLTTSPVMISKKHLPHNQNTPVPHTSPLAKPLPQTAYSSNTQLSEEEIAKMKRKERQRLMQEEFRKKHLLEQEQAKATSQNVSQQSRLPLKEQQGQNRQLKETNTAANALDGDDDDLLSTQEIATIVEIAANTTASTSNFSKRTPIVSSPSIAKSSISESRIQVPQAKSSTGQKRPDLSNYAFNPEKKPRGQQ